jgi:hypothetical protein
MNTVVFVASLGHSGSTLLDLLLGGHPRFIGLGEIAQVIVPGKVDLLASSGQLCSCGETVTRCPFWGEVAKRLPDAPQDRLDVRYRLVLDTFAEVFGDSLIPVDSSKYLHHLERVVSVAGLDVRVLRLAKDVRAFAVSQIDNARAKRLGWIKRRAFAQFHIWHRGNRDLDRYVDASGLPSLRVGYEELCLSSGRVIPGICAFLREDFSPDMLDIGRSRSHVLVGNRMRTSASDRAAITYDYRWFCRHEWLLPSMLLPHVMRYNQRAVYANGTLGRWRR